MVFIGNPGTGKTTVAKLYGCILKHLGILSKGELISKSTSDFIGSALGQSENQTKAILSASEGCVLLIDEAYGLNPRSDSGLANGGGDPYRNAAVDTLVAGVQNIPGEDRCVLMCGYKEEMTQFFNDANPGAKRRFGWHQAIEFEDYTKEQLKQILVASLRERSLLASEDVLETALSVLEQQKNQRHFGNAGAVNNLVSVAIQSLTQRLNQLTAEKRKNATRSVLIHQDFRSDHGKERSIQDIFSGIIGCQKVVEKLRDLQTTIQYAKYRNRSDCFAEVARNFLFLGPPGTGKTSVARLMGKIFYSFGLLSSEEVLETSASNFMTGFVGQSGPRTLKVLREAMGKVLFIDEAYRLNPERGGAFGQEVLDELVNAITSSEFKNKLVIILAGYDTDISQLLLVNQGLSSRFTEKYEFSSFTVEECWDVLYSKLEMKEFLVAEDCRQDKGLTQLMKALINTTDWGNGRDLETLATKTIRYLARTFEAESSARVAAGSGGGSEKDVVNAQHLRAVMEEMLKEKEAHEIMTMNPRAESLSSIISQPACKHHYRSAH